MQYIVKRYFFKSNLSQRFFTLQFTNTGKLNQQLFTKHFSLAHLRSSCSEIIPLRPCFKDLLEKHMTQVVVCTISIKIGCAL